MRGAERPVDTLRTRSERRAQSAKRLLCTASCRSRRAGSAHRAACLTRSVTPALRALRVKQTRSGARAAVDRTTKIGQVLLEELCVCAERLSHCVSAA